MAGENGTTFPTKPQLAHGSPETSKLRSSELQKHL